MSTIEALKQAIRTEAEKEPFPIDTPVYEKAGLDPLTPIPYAGNLESRLCFFARDLGRDEVKMQQPLYGAAGRLVRRGVFVASRGEEPQGIDDHHAVLEDMIVTNTVPYKPPGNKAYKAAVKKRFRPFLERLLVLHWQGNQIITLGNEAFKWFSPYGARGELKNFFERPDRYEATLPVTLRAQDDEGVTHEREVLLAPLPHPSPLNQQYYKRFPTMLLERLEGLGTFAS